MLFQRALVRKEHMIDRCGDIDRKNQMRKHHNYRRKERKRSRSFGLVLAAPLVRTVLSGKASLCASLGKIKKGLEKASLTVETALVLPLFFFGMVTMISFMDIYKLQTEHLSVLCQKTKQAGMYAYVLDGSGVEEITLPDIYSYQPVGGFIPFSKVRMYNVVKVHAWTGTEHKSGEGTEESVETMVYVTEKGQVYHKKLECTYLNLSVTQVAGSRVSNLRNDYGEKYHACEICSRYKNPSGTVYITEKGNRYHNERTCSGLKRSVRLVKESELEGMRCCSRCG